jgi:hypothetical protein
MKHRDSNGLRSWRCLPQVLIVLLVLPPNVGAQQPTDAAKPMAPLPTVRNLKVMALAGDGEMNDLELKVMAPLVVDVLDQNGRPVEGAAVVFRFPLNGPSATFSNGEKAKTVRTNADGQAAAVDWMANGGPGKFQVHVNASRGNELGEAVISMSNVERVTEESKKNKGKQKSVWSSKWVKIGIVAGVAGAVVGIVLATRGGSTSTVSASPGTPTIGGPR